MALIYNSRWQDENRIAPLFLYFLFSTLLSLSIYGQTFATNSSISVSIDNPTIDLDIFPHKANGDFAKSTSSIVSVSTTNYSGYTLKIESTNASNSLINTVNNAEVINSINSAVSESDFSADTSVAATNYNGKWGYLPSKLNSTANTNFQPSPGTGSNAHVIDTTSAANTTANTYTLAIGARVDIGTAPGTYNKTFIISAIANLINYTVSFNKGNTTDTVTGIPTSITGSIVDPSSGSTAIGLPSTTPSRDKYNFSGWCTVLPVYNGDADTCSGTTYSAGGNYDLNASTNPQITLYAMWEKIDYLYDRVKDLWIQGGSRVQTNDTNSSVGIKAAINSSNSGVFKYDASVFGAASDASNTNDIYYYRGILDSDLDGSSSTYGSNGNGAVWPNYVKLGNTCWRIVRTTGSGGIKMIYNGLYSSGTTANSCANATTNAQVTTSVFDSTAASNGKSIVGVGYTYNANYKTTTATTTAGVLFGTNTNYSGNSSNSTIKNYIENTWFSSANGISAYESLLEPSAGYCNDRSVYDNNNNALNDSSSISTPYTTGSSVTRYYFGGRTRTITTIQSLTLTCPRNVVDLYTASGAQNGNLQLGKPVALLTADEVSFAGSGSGTPANGSGQHNNSYLRSGARFWLMSPYYRDTTGYAGELNLIYDSTLNSNNIITSYGVRPAISLNSSTVVASGSGTAVDPWEIDAP